ncbi:MAG TPA: choice-of-anchor Q domain-containing protein, partial [Rhodoglobus sp.]|nr:choice-of-anchor Q domain-containing protein [Rhodoglobus sp.]
PNNPSHITNLAGTRFSVPDPVLGPLQNNGGPTPTRLPLPGSPALDKGDPAVSGEPLWDQRGAGYPRVDGRIDIGAIEVPRVLPNTGQPLNGSIVVAGILLLIAGLGMALQGRRELLRHRAR